MAGIAINPMPYEWDDVRFQGIVLAELERQGINDADALKAANLDPGWLKKHRSLGRSVPQVMSLLQVLGLPPLKTLNACLKETPSRQPLPPREQRRKRRARRQKRP